MTMGAGDVTAIGPELVAALLQRRAPRRRRDVRSRAHTSGFARRLAGYVKARRAAWRGTPRSASAGRPRSSSSATRVADLALATSVLAEEEVEWTVLGKGSNVLVADAGYDGAVIVLGSDFKRHSLDDGHLRAGAGVILAALVQDAFRAGLTGLEFAVGIPGTLGGALAMNAGSRDEWIGSVVESVTLFVPGEGLVGAARARDRLGVPHDRSARPRDHRRGGRCGWSRATSGGSARTMEASLEARKRTQPLGYAERRQRLREPRGRLGRAAHRGVGTQGHVASAARSLRGARQLHREHRRGDGADVVALVRLVRDAVKEHAWHRTQAGNPVPRVVRRAVSAS